VAERLPEHLLLGRVGQVFFGAHHVADLHCDVVDHVGENEDGRAVAAQQYEIFDGRVVELHATANFVVHHGGSGGNLETQHTARRCREAAVARIAVVARLARRFRALLDLFGGEVAVIRVAAVEQRLRRRDVCLGERRLEVRALEMRVRRRDADPVERVDDALRPLRLVARLVGVFDAQDEGAAGLQREYPVVQRSARTTHVEIARR